MSFLSRSSAWGPLDLLHYLLSLLAPRFVEFWLLDYPPLYVYENGGYPLLINACLVLVVVVVAPFAEEVFFRGFLFRRLTRKWNLTSGLLVSSGLFAIGHADVLGAFCFGIVMAVLYKTTRSLWVPVAVHAFNNLLGSILWVVLNHTETIFRWETIPDFQSEWRYGAVCLLVGGAWLAWFLRRYWPQFTAEPLIPRPAIR